MNRNLSPQQMFLQLAREHQPTHAFREGADFESWKRETLPLVLQTIGDYPSRVPLNDKFLARWEHDGLRKERYVIDVSPYLSATLLVNYPADLKEGEKRATICCWHGHGGTGKDPIMGNDNDPLLAGQIRQMNYNYGHQMAKNGFITYAIDWMGQGEHREDNKPNWNMQAGGRDWCNLYYLLATMLGQTSISNHIVHAKAATDFVCSLPEVDENRLGVMGLSGGGTMTTWNALCDERFKAVEIMCYADLWQNFLFRDLNACGMQVAPGLFKLVDLPDLQGLLAPKPLLMDIGTYDSCFDIDGAMECYQKVEKIYSAAGARDRLDLDLFPGEHAWGGRKSKEFFSKYLG